MTEAQASLGAVLIFALLGFGIFCILDALACLSKWWLVDLVERWRRR